MKGDFTRDTFDPRKHFSRVLMQQGRVTVDADPNEQAAILLHYLRTLAADLIGPHAAPAGDGGFELDFAGKKGVSISAGRYYVDGILVENDPEPGEVVTYLNQPDYPVPDSDPFRQEIESPSGETYWLYLDVWERHVTHIEDDSIREKALGGPDTRSRAQVLWQVKALGPEALEALLDGGLLETLAEMRNKLEELRAQLKQANAAAKARISKEIAALEEEKQQLCNVPLATLPGLSDAALAAQVDPGRFVPDPCEIRPDARYRGLENHLYRVEIHASGKAPGATFKWSRDNGSVATRWLGTQGHELEVASARGFSAGAWVELSHDLRELRGEPGVLVKLAKTEGNVLTVDPDSVASGDTLAWSEDLVNPKVRRWDQAEREDVVLVKGAVPVVEQSPDGSEVWIDLEDGVQVRFAAGGEYRTGDYWLIPARVATGSIEWPEGAPPPAVAPRGVRHHYAPLGFVSLDADGMTLDSCRCEFQPARSCGDL